MTRQPVISPSSDHLPIIVYISRLSDIITYESRTFVKHGKVRWPEFREFTMLRFRFWGIRMVFLSVNIKAAAARYITAGRRPEIRSIFLAETAGLTYKHDDLLRFNPQNQ